MKPDHPRHRRSLVGKRIEEWLLRQGWSRGDLAREMGRNPTLINDIVIGRQRVTLEIAFLLEHATGVRAETWAVEDALWAVQVTRPRAVATLLPRQRESVVDESITR